MAIGGKTVKDVDVISAIFSNEAFHFLKLDFPRKQAVIPAAQPRKPAPGPALKSKGRPLPAASVINSNAAITNFFSASNRGTDAEADRNSTAQAASLASHELLDQADANELSESTTVAVDTVP